MIMKERELPIQLKVLRALNKRSILLNPQTTSLDYRMKGYEGECQFDAAMKSLKCDCLVLNDLMLKVNGQTCQIDTLLITPMGATIYEVKNYEGQFVYSDDKFKIRSTNKEISNPLLQLNRSMNLLRQLMEEQRVSFPLNGLVVFINNRFTLFQAPVADSFIFPTMLSYHLIKLNSMRKSLNQCHHRFAETLKQLHVSDTKFVTLPEYDFQDLRKGPFCDVCMSEVRLNHGRKWKCRECGAEAVSHKVILDQIKDFRLLFPEKKVQTGTIYEWCGKLISKKSIRNVLTKHFELKGESKATYYE
ncbi:nuclease-related domain-containing protein [Alkalibacterium kapii]|uniref:NERD domain-containing protein n=1 Tax=Alkalibacterium kapii TaxID=426704 RepID=A0A511ARL2_9LACT|nr:nuclease-related domain-containing protein [Alkalibacterium kapii]GEK90726.1 hypothetical protein AKA01nite_03480 [Alkalibacterium kapii]